MNRKGCVLLLVLALMLLAGIAALVIRDGILTQEKLRHEARQIAVPTYHEALDKCPEMVEWATREDVVVESAVVYQTEGQLSMHYDVRPGPSHPWPSNFARVDLRLYRRILEEEGFLWYYVYEAENIASCDTVSLTSN
jgi:hypothetical protein